MSNLVILAILSVFEVSCGKTDRHTQTNGGINFTPATAVGVGNKKLHITVV